MCGFCFVFNDAFFQKRKKKEKRISSVLTEVDTPGKKKKKKEKGRSTLTCPRTKYYEEMRMGEAVEGGGWGDGKQTRVKGTPASNNDLTVI